MNKSVIRIIALYLGVLMLAPICFGCVQSAGPGATSPGKPSSPASDGSSGSNETPARDDLIVIIPDDFTTLDPHKLPSNPEINFCANLFDPLVSLNANFEPTPALAESWKHSDDGLSYTFKLREGVMFHNGEELKASDVVYTVERYIQEEWMMWASFMIDSAEAIDEYTVQINLKYAYGSFLGLLYAMYIVNEKAMEEMGDSAARNPVGTGAYKFVSWSPSQQIVLEANENYYLGAPSIKKLTFKIIPDANSAYIALETGEADLAFNVAGIDYLEAQKNDRFKTDACTGAYCYYVCFNAEKLPKQARQALCYAIDKDTVNIMVNEGLGIVTDLPLVNGQEGFTTELETYSYDPEKAKAILADAGIDPASLKLDFFYGESTANSKLGQALQSMFSAIGVSLELRPVETGTWWQLFGDGDYTISRGGYPMEDANTDCAYYDIYHSEGTFNVSRINDPLVDQLLDEGRRELDSTKRHELYVQVAQHLAQEAYQLPLYFNLSTVVYDANLKNVRAVNSQRYIYREFSW